MPPMSIVTNWFRVIATGIFMWLLNLSKFVYLPLSVVTSLQIHKFYFFELSEKFAEKQKYKIFSRKQR